MILSIAGIWYIMWNNIGKDEEQMGSIESLPTNDTETGRFWYVDCQRAMKGIFVGKNCSKRFLLNAF